MSLTGAFSSFTFKVNIVMNKFNSVIMMLAGYFTHWLMQNFFIVSVNFTIWYVFAVAGTSFSFSYLVLLLGALIAQAWW